jgi:DNA-binding CsgD family transcriptional regulator
MSRVTPAERRALEAWWRAETVKEAAAALGKSPRTIEQQMATARARLGVTTSKAALRALRIVDEPTT